MDPTRKGVHVEVEVVRTLPVFDAVSIQNRPTVFITDHSKHTTFVTDLFITDHVDNRSRSLQTASHQTTY